MKHLFKPLLTALLLLCSIVVNAHDFEVDGFYYNVLSEEDKTVEVTYRGSSSSSYSNEYSGAVVIPKEVSYKGGSYKVTSIKSSAFSGCSSLTSIDIPDGVTSIGSGAFFGCSSLTSIEIPNSVTSIGNATFNDCSSLTSITIPNSVTSIGSGAFRDCSNLTNIEIPNSVTSIGNAAFYNCSNLKDVINFSNLIFSKGSEDYGYIAYYANKVINAPNGTIVNDFVFCAQNEKNRLAAYLGNEKEITLPENYKGEDYYIGEYAFENCDSLTSIIIPNSVTSIGNYAFDRCSSLTSIAIPNSVTSIGNYAFDRCSSLTSIAIPNSVTSIGSGAFSDCTGLTSIIVDTSNTIYDSRQNCNAVIETASNTLIIGCRNTIIPNSVTSIGSRAFDGCSNLTSIEIPNSVTTIGHYAFSGCQGISELTIPNSVTSIENNAFEDCIGIKRLCIEDGNTTLALGYQEIFRTDMHGTSIIENIIGLFGHCPTETLYLGRNLAYQDYIRLGMAWEYDISPFSGAIENITIGNCVTVIYRWQFRYCRLRSISISSSVKMIHQDAFIGCTRLEEVHISDLAAWCNIDFSTQVFGGYNGQTSYSYACNPLYYAKKLYLNGELIDNLVIPDGVETIKHAVFYNCTNITSIVIPKSVRNIEHRVFEGCTNIKELYIEDGDDGDDGDDFLFFFPGMPDLGSVETLYLGRNIGYDYSLESSPFSNSKNLKNVRIGNSIKSLSFYLFYGCSALESIYIPEGVSLIGEYTFANCTNLKQITIPATMVDILSGSFADCSSLETIISHIPADKLCPPLQYHDNYLKEKEAFENVDKDRCTLYVPYGAKNTYATTEGWKEFKNIVEFRNKYKITFIFDKEELATDSITEGDTIKYPEMPKREGYTFIWEPYLDIMPSNNITINGKYIPNSYLITYKVDGEIYATDSIKYGATITPIAEPTKEGHTFSGWSEIPETMPANDVVVEGSFSINTYNITYKVDGEIYATDSIKYGATIESIAEPTKEGHTFSGWSEIPETMPAEDIIIEGSFSINSYTITYKVDGEIYATDSVKFGATIEPIAEPTKEGHTFSGWSEIPETMPAKNIVVEGSFSINTYNITYKVDGEIYATDSIKYGATIESIAEPTKEGHTFSGWSEIPETMPANDVVIEGTFSVNSYTVILMIDGVIYKAITVDYGIEIELPTPPVKKGYTFNGWVDVPATMPAEDIIIEGSYSTNSYTITYKVDGEIYATDSIKYGATIEPIVEPTKEGHTFSGWSEIPETMPANDVVIEGSFSINCYTVTFMVDGEVYETMTVEYGAEIELPTPPEKEGYIFTGWIGVPATMPAEDIVIEGRFEVDTTGINAVTLDLEKNEVYNLKGQRITESENLTRGIYIVNGKKVYIK